MTFARIFSVLALLSTGLACRPPAPAPAPAPKAPAAAPDLSEFYEKTDILVTLDEFQRVMPGMDADAVYEIIGSDETKRSSRVNPADESGFTRPSVTITLRWDNPDGSWAEFEFRDKKVDVKRHQDLKPASAYAHSKFSLPEDRKLPD